MTLEQLIAELMALSIAYPADTPVQMRFREQASANVVGVQVLSDADSLTISIEVQ